VRGDGSFHFGLLLDEGKLVKLIVVLGLGKLLLRD